MNIHFYNTDLLKNRSEIFLTFPSISVQSGYVNQTIADMISLIQKLNRKDCTNLEFNSSIKHLTNMLQSYKMEILLENLIREFPLLFLNQIGRRPASSSEYHQYFFSTVLIPKHKYLKLIQLINKLVSGQKINMVNLDWYLEFYPIYKKPFISFVKANAEPQVVNMLNLLE